MFELKRLSAEAIPHALELALRYRTLNEPELAQSICLDVLAVDPGHQQARSVLILALTDRFHSTPPATYAEAAAQLGHLRGGYDREYYAGIICERQAIARMRSHTPGAGAMAHDWFRKAMHHYEAAEAARPPGNDDALLRWNTCARLIMSHPSVRPADDAVEVAPSLGE